MPTNDPPRSIDQAYTMVRDTDPDVLDRDELAEFLDAVSQIRAWCDARQVRATRRQRQLAEQGRAEQAEHALSNHGRQSSKDARTAAEREQVCTSMPGFEDALSSGDVSAGHVDAVANATRNLDDAERAEFIAEADSLLDSATGSSVDRFGKDCRDLAKSIRARHNAQAAEDELERQRAQSKVTRWVDQTTGMHKTLIECDPVTDRAIWSAINTARGRLRRRCQQTGERKGSWDRLTVDAVVDAVTNGHGAHSQLVVHIGLAQLTDLVADSATVLCETDTGIAIPPETMRRIACDADIIPIVLDGAGVVIDEGRGKRLATPEQRIAIETMHTTCVHPQCSVTVDECRIHHTTPWQYGGRTDLADLAPLCETHHHLVHEGRWNLTITPDRTATWTRPDGTLYWTGPTNTRTNPAA
ncbi:MAG: HNH endonuclease [Ilumatobacter sp.]|nr:HNH endonuclease [Ilumatobacter sp.]